MAGEDLFENPEINDPKSETPTTEGRKYLEELVGEGKKYADPEALAKSRIHADNHITQLEKDNEELRQELARKHSQEEFLESLRQAKAPTPTPTTPREPPEEERFDGPTEISQSTVKSLISEAMEEFVGEQRAKDNLTKVRNELQRRLGDGYQTAMRDRARQLGESQQDLLQLAASKPQVFLALMAPEGGRATNEPPMPPRTQVNMSQAHTNSGKRDQRYYQQLKVQDPKKYFSRETRVQMMNDAIAQGEAFYN